MFYVYKLLNPLKNNIPFYVGKGQDRRAYRHFQAIDWKESDSNPHKKRTLLQIKEAGLEPGVEIIPCETETLAYEIEIKLINGFGRAIDGGILTNLCKGGEGNSSGERAIHQYNVYKELIMEHKSILAAARSIGKRHSTSIVDACKKNNRARAPHGFVWCYANETPDWEWVYQKIKPVYQWSPNGNLVNRFPSAHAAGKITGFDATTITRFCNSISKDRPYRNGLSNGYIWTYHFPL